ncbi:hypothetical protein OUY22_12410 [Nonomuraea sp. MCN248]|uniref:Uncharacterized protein n=1 Tax=Nonomuraea corallina TaxID=2989783 RepID=A0ABT4SAI8_9ACTN|nr:hypothetical protein [Nonomuraea corallina]MDA0634221.1 hypothetical protein [Nonomuraea corallina]
MNATLIRRALAALTVIAVLGAGFELAVERHWRSATQLVPWAALGLLAVGVLLLLLNRVSGVVRAIAAVVLAASAFGVFAHVSANMTVGTFSGALDGVSAIGQWWQAFTKSVGDTPPLAPGMLAQAALLLLLATYVGHRAPAPRHAQAPAAVRKPAGR